MVLGFGNRKHTKVEGDKVSVSYGQGVQKQFLQHLYSQRQMQILDMVAGIDRVEKTIDIDEKDLGAFLDRGWDIDKRLSDDKGLPTGRVQMVKYEESEAVKVLKTQLLATQGLAEIGDRARPSAKALRGFEKLLEYYTRDQENLGKNHALVKLDRALIVRACARLFNASVTSYHTDINVFEAPQQNPYQSLADMLNKSGSMEK